MQKTIFLFIAKLPGQITANHLPVFLKSSYMSPG